MALQDDVVIDLSSDEEGESLVPGKTHEDSNGPHRYVGGGGLHMKVEVRNQVSAAVAPAQMVLKNDSGGWNCETEDSEDDDCQVLDGDPDKVDIADNGDEEDELKIVGQKGQIACRDFPHSRHMCANFPFSSTPHADYCIMCHCYVCDCPAPCIYWGDGSSFMHHCNATDEVPQWSVLRKKLQEQKSQTAMPPKLRQLLQYPAQMPPHPSMPPNSMQQHYRAKLQMVQSLLSGRAGNSIPNFSATHRASSQTRFKRPGAVRVHVPNIRSSGIQSQVRDMQSQVHVPQVVVPQPFRYPAAHPPGYPFPWTTPSQQGEPLRPISLNIPASNKAPSLQNPANSQMNTCWPPIPYSAAQGYNAPALQPRPTAMQSAQFVMNGTNEKSWHEPTAPQFVMNDIDRKSWGDILASLASDLGVPYPTSTAPSDEQAIGPPP